MHSLPSGALQPTFSHYNEKKQTNIQYVSIETIGEPVKKIGHSICGREGEGGRCLSC